ncbi:unnamed protein product [Gordionus sp. m RMFG-2023]
MSLDKAVNKPSFNISQIKGIIPYISNCTLLSLYLDHFQNINALPTLSKLDKEEFFKEILSYPRHELRNCKLKNTEFQGSSVKRRVTNREFESDTINTQRTRRIQSVYPIQQGGDGMLRQNLKNKVKKLFYAKMIVQDVMIDLEYIIKDWELIKKKEFEDEQKFLINLTKKYPGIQRYLEKQRNSLVRRDTKPLIFKDLSTKVADDTGINKILKAELDPHIANELQLDPPKIDGHKPKIALYEKIIPKQSPTKQVLNKHHEKMSTVKIIKNVDTRELSPVKPQRGVVSLSNNDVAKTIIQQEAYLVDKAKTTSQGHKKVVEKENSPKYYVNRKSSKDKIDKDNKEEKEDRANKLPEHSMPSKSLPLLGNKSNSPPPRPNTRLPIPKQQMSPPRLRLANRPERRMSQRLVLPTPPRMNMIRNIRNMLPRLNISNKGPIPSPRVNSENV